jgi:hypothetical protein
MIVVDISSDEHAVKVDVRGGETGITIIRSSGSLPSTMADISIGLFVIDVRHMTHEETGLLSSIPGRSKLVDCPVVIIGGAAEVEEARKAIVRASGNQWSGQLRSMFILTSDSNSQYSCSSKRLLLMIPPGPAVPKLPPMANLTHVTNMTLGWVTVIGLLQPWWSDPVGSAQADHKVTWVYAISDDRMLPVLLSTRLEKHPSLLHASLHAAPNIGHIGEEIGHALQTAESVPPLRWGDVRRRGINLHPLDPQETVHELESEGERDVSPAAERAAPKPKPAPKVTASPKPKKQVVKKTPRAKPKPTPESPTQDAIPSTSSGRLQSRLASPDPEEERLRERERERERQRELDGDKTRARAEREKEKDREKEKERLRELEARLKERDRERSRERERERERERDRERDREAERRRLDRERERSRERSSSHSVTRRTPPARGRGGELQRRLGRHAR